MELVGILKETFQFAKQASRSAINNNGVIVDRVDQLNMLLDSLWKLEEYEASIEIKIILTNFITQIIIFILFQECYFWSEACLNEAWKTYMNSSDETVQKKWLNTILKILEKLDACTTEVSVFIGKNKNCR